MEFREPKVFFGTCDSFLDADEFIFAKAEEGWSVLVPPFPTQYVDVALKDQGIEEIMSFKYPDMWGFVLHKF